MASPVACDKLLSNVAATMIVKDADMTTATDIGWVDMRGYDTFTVLCALSNLGSSGGLAALTIVANSNSTGTGDEAVIVEHADTTGVGVEGEYVVLECTADQVAHEGAESGHNLRYVSAKATTDNADDELTLVYILGGAHWAQDGLTADDTA